MAKFMKVSGEMVLKKAKAYGKEFMVILTQASGSSLRLMAMEFISGKTEIDTKANGSFVLSMAKAQIFLQMVMFIMASTKMANHMALDNINGRTLRYMLVSLNLV